MLCRVPQSASRAPCNIYFFFTVSRCRGGVHLSRKTIYFLLPLLSFLSERNLAGWSSPFKGIMGASLVAQW